MNLEFALDVTLAMLVVIALCLIIGDIIRMLTWRERAIALRFLVIVAVIAALVLAQKLLPAKAVGDVRRHRWRGYA